WPCVGESRIVPDYISLFPGSKEVAPFAGATRNLCDRKEVTLGDQMGTTAKFYIYTSTHIASKFTGVVTDDFTSEFDPFSPQFGEKFSPPNLPVSIKDWTGAEISRVYTDQWGAYSGLQYSTWEVNPPNPTGYSPTMGIVCMNDPGSGATPDPLFNPGYSQFCYELPFMPGTMQYFDTPVVPTSAFSEGYNHPDCAYPATVPAISKVDGDGMGPWVKAAGGNGIVGSVTITNGGSGYTSAPTVTFGAAPTGGTTATGTAVLGSGSVGSVTVTANGSNYTSAPTVTFGAPPSGGTTATGTAVISGKVSGVTVTKGGSGYCLTALVTFSAPQLSGGTPAIGAAVLTGFCGSVKSVTIVDPGSGYTAPPTVTFSALVGSGAAGTATINEGVSSVTVTNPGSGYTSAPTITFAGGGGSGAAANTTVTRMITAVNITNPGSGYLTAPTVTLAGGGGTGATATAALASSSAGSGIITITALGDVPVINNGYSGPSATTAPFNQKTVNRHYGFGKAQGKVTVGGVTAPIISWSDASIQAVVPTGMPNCVFQQQAQYGGSTAQCGQLVITTAAGVQSVDTVTVTVGGKAPTTVTGTIQSAIDAAAPGDLIMVPSGVYNELVLMWKPVRLQGEGAASTVINANTHPAGKLDPWRRQVNCLFGLAINGQPYTGNFDPNGAAGNGGKNPFDPSGAYSCGSSSTVQNFTGGPNNPQIDRLPLEGILGWDTTVNGNLAQLLQEPTLLGAYEGAGITVLGKGVNIPAGAANPFGNGSESAFPTGTTVLTAKDCATGPNGTNLYASNFLCNPSRIDGLSVTNSSQGGGGIFVHAWGHNIEISNNRVYNNIGTLSGGLNIGQGESPDAYLAGTPADSDPGSCITGNPTGDPNQQLPYCFNLNVNVHNNSITANSSIGDELFSGTPAGAGGVSFCTGDDNYLFQYNWVCG
ncbi:MAG: hypothetical protein JOY92_16305, partial [Verrucomicrobia bacterium]|nr:hypothetical protein [Verrucomicrobiota bacterium]